MLDPVRTAPESPRHPDPAAAHTGEGQHWAQIAAALNSPVESNGPSDFQAAAQIANLAKEAATTADPVRRGKDMADLQAALRAMQSDPATLSGTIAEADKLLEGTGLKFAQTPGGEVWEGSKQADGTYQATNRLAWTTDTPPAGGSAAGGSDRATQSAAVGQAPQDASDIPRAQSYRELQEQHRRDEGALNAPIDGNKSDAQAAQQIAALAKKLEEQRAHAAETERLNPEIHLPPDFRTRLQLSQVLKNLTASGDPELLNGTLAAANKLLEQDGLKFALNEGRIVEGKKYPGNERYLYNQDFNLQALKY
jgi:hypothetical protein